jgi:hypothetical protein
MRSLPPPDKRFEANAYAKTFLEDQLKQLS